MLTEWGGDQLQQSGRMNGVMLSYQSGTQLEAVVAPPFSYWASHQST